MFFAKHPFLMVLLLLCEFCSDHCPLLHLFLKIIFRYFSKICSLLYLSYLTVVFLTTDISQHVTEYITVSIFFFLIF